MVVASLLFFEAILAVKLKQQVKSKSKEKTTKTVEKTPLPAKEESAGVDCTTNCNSCAEMDNGMRDSMKLYDQHIIIITNTEDWPSHIEQDDFFKPVIDSINKNKQKEAKLKITAMLCSEEDLQARENRLAQYSSDLTKVLDILIYPENLLFSVRMSQIDHFSSFIGSHTTIDAAAIQKYVGFSEADAIIIPPVTPSFKKLVLVCTYGSR